MFRRRTNKLVWIIGIPVIVYGLAKGGMYLKVKKTLDDFIMQNSTRVGIKYSDVETDLRGIVRVNNISVTPVGETEPVSIMQLLIKGPDAFSYVLNHNPVTGDQGPPAHLNVMLNGVSMSLEGNLAKDIGLGETGAAAAESSACSPGGQVSLATLADMGMKRLNMDGGFSYRYDAARRTMDVSSSIDVQEIQSVNLRGSLANVSPASLPAGLPGVDKLTLTINVLPAFGEKLTAYCAEKTGLTGAAYAAKAANDLVRDMADQGVVLGRGLRNAVRDFYRNWGEIEIKLNPISTLSPMSLMKVPPEKYVERLGLELTVNGQFVTDLGVEFSKGTTLLGASKPSKPQKAPPRKPLFKREYRVVNVGDLAAYIDRPVRIHVLDQPIRSGILSDVRAQQVAVQQRVEGGKFTAHVALGDIEKVEVEQLIRIDPPSAPEQAEQQQAATEGSETATQ